MSADLVDTLVAPDECVASFDNLYTLRRSVFRTRITTLTAERMDQACGALRHALACR